VSRYARVPSKRSTVARGSVSAEPAAGEAAAPDDGRVVLGWLPGGGPPPIIGKPLTAK
jgi:hypothetical protein